MLRLLCVFLSVIFFSVHGMAAHSFAGIHKHEAPSLRIIGEVDTWTEQDYDDAEIALQAALLAAQGDFNKQLSVLQGLADLYHERNKYKEEEEALLALIRVMSSIDAYPLVYLAAEHLRLSYVYFVLANYKEAESNARVAVDLFEKSCGKESPNLAFAYNNLGWIELTLKNFTSAQVHFEKSLFILNKSIGNKNLLYGLIAENLGALYSKTGDHQSAYKWYRASLKTLKNFLDKDDPLRVDITSRAKQALLLSRTSRTKSISSSNSKNKLAGENKSQK